MIWFFAGPAVTRRARGIKATSRPRVFTPRTASAHRKGSDIAEPGMASGVAGSAGTSTPRSSRVESHARDLGVEVGAIDGWALELGIASARRARKGAGERPYGARPRDPGLAPLARVQGVAEGRAHRLVDVALDPRAPWEPDFAEVGMVDITGGEDDRSGRPAMLARAEPPQQPGP